jgi:predicted transcriptional regulator
MVVAIVIIFAAIVALACVVGRRFSSINKSVDDIFHKLFTQEGQLSEHKIRLDAYIKDITSNQKRIDEVDNSLYKHIKERCINNAYSAEERETAEKIILAKYGEQSLRSIAKELGISATTINRWTKALKESGKLQ